MKKYGLSIIICSINENRFNDLAKNISETIGDVEYEICKIDNRLAKMPITKAYNLAADSSKHEFLLFLHEDVKFKTINWGPKLLEALYENKIGVVGIAGSTYVPFAPCGYTNPVKKFNYANLIQWSQTVTKRYSVIPADLFSLKAVDGVFLGVRKSVYEEIRFNENIPGFHGYDLDFSLRVSEKYKNRLIENILIEHFSQGNPDKQYWENIIQIKKNIVVINNINDQYNEYSAYRSFIKEMLIFRFSRYDVLRNGIYFLCYSRLGFIDYFKSIMFLMCHFFKAVFIR